MKSTVEKLNPTRVKLSVEVPFDELKPSLDKAYAAIAKQVNVPGFRKGKVPPAVIDRQVGRGAVLSQAMDDVVNRSYQEAIRENDLTPLSQPEIDLTEFADNEPVKFTAELDVVPAFDLPEYDSVKAEVDAVEVTDADLKEQIEFLRERFGTLKDVERAAKKDDFVTIDLTATRDGEAVEGAAVTSMSYQVGKGGMIEGLDKALTGMKAGDSKTFTSQLVGGDLVGEDVEVTVTVGQVSEQELPAYDEDFVTMASEFDTVAEFETDIRERLERGKRVEQAAAARDAVLEALIGRVEIPLPETLLTDQTNYSRQQFEQQLAWGGVTLAQYLEDEKQTVEDFEADLARRAHDSLVAQFLLDAIARKEELTAAPEELQAFMIRRASQSGQDPNEFFKHMQEHPHHVGEYAAELVRSKALQRLMESAEVKDSKGEVVELKNLRADGSIFDGVEGDAEDHAGHDHD